MFLLSLSTIICFCVTGSSLALQLSLLCDWALLSRPLCPALCTTPQLPLLLASSLFMLLGGDTTVIRPKLGVTREPPSDCGWLLCPVWGLVVTACVICRRRIVSMWRSPPILCSAASAFVIPSCFFHLVRRFWNHIFTCNHTNKNALIKCFNIYKSIECIFLRTTLL